LYKLHLHTGENHDIERRVKLAEAVSTIIPIGGLGGRYGIRTHVLLLTEIGVVDPSIQLMQVYMYDHLAARTIGPAIPHR